MSIIIDQVKGNPGRTERKYIYQDIHLDLLDDPVPMGKAMITKSTTMDIKVDHDEAAIMNSLKNIFNTTPGAKILSPEFGVNLIQWLFEPINEFNGREIAEAVLDGIKRFEPRVGVDNVSVIVNASKSEYEIKLVLTIPSINIINREYEAILNQPGFDFLTPK